MWGTASPPGGAMQALPGMISTIPLIAPVMQTMGFGRVRFGIVSKVRVQTALITAPVGLNLFALHKLRKIGSMNDVMLGSRPSVAAMVVLLLLPARFDGLVLWLPGVLS